MTSTTDPFKGAARSLTPAQRASVAAFRFGLGPKPGTLERLSVSPSAAFEACWNELSNPRAALITVPRTPEQDLEKCCSAGGVQQTSAFLSYEELGVRYAKHLEPDVGFVERLVLFWANHFSIHGGKSVAVRATLGHFERTVIRRHVLGSFPDMLKAAISHPCMVGYLDNHSSRKGAVNENLAREILELYTVGTSKRYRGRSWGYTQADVEAMAGMLTGWSINFDLAEKSKEQGNRYGQFLFRQNWHDERSYVLMGQSFGGGGQAKGFDALQWLATHSFTAQNIAYKLLRHFVCDDPPDAMVNELRHIFWFHKGNLLEVAKYLLRMEAVWTAPLRLRPPHLWVVAQARAMGFGPEDFGTLPTQVENFWQNRLRALNNAAWNWLTPDGYPDNDAEWLDPDAMRMRVLVANQLLGDAESRGRKLPAADVLRQQVLPGSSRVTSLSGVPASLHNRAAIADLFLSSEFMTR
jgi:uncharacterized protein (DUF1800 family)